MTHALHSPRTRAAIACILVLDAIAWILILCIVYLVSYGAAELLRWAFG